MGKLVEFKNKNEIKKAYLTDEELGLVLEAIGRLTYEEEKTKHIKKRENAGEVAETIYLLLNDLSEYNLKLLNSAYEKLSKD